MYRNVLVTEDATATLIICRRETNSDQVATCRRLKAVVKETIKETAPAIKIYYGGIPFMILDLQHMITDDLKVLIPMVSIVIIFFLFLGFRKWEGVFLPLLSVAMSLLWTLGIMSLFKFQLSIISNIIPVVLIAVGNAYTIHVLSKFNETHQPRRPRHRLVRGDNPGLLCWDHHHRRFSLLYFRFLFVMIREFGVFAALGVLFALFISLTFIPALLALKKKALDQPDRKGEEEMATENLVVLPGALPGIEKFVTEGQKPLFGWVFSWPSSPSPVSPRSAAGLT